MPNTGMTSTTVDDLLAISIQEANLVLNQGFNLRDFILKRNIRGKVARFPLYGSLTSTALTEGVPITSYSDLATSSVDITAGEHGLTVPVTDVVDLGYEQAYADAGKEIGQSILRELNQNIFALFDNFTATFGGTYDSSSGATISTDAMSEDLLAKAYYTLLSNNAPKPYYVAVSPFVYSALLKLYSSNTNTTADGFKSTALGTGIVPDIYGMKVLQITDLTPEVATADTIKCGVFSQSAIGYANGWDIRIEPERSGRLRGSFLTGTAFYGVGIINPAWGVELHVDNV